MEHILQYYILISCPSDVEKKKYVKAIKETIDTFNNLYGRNYMVSLKSLYWRDDVFPEFGDAPQNIINKQIVSLADMNIAVFCTRWGQPTENYGSATEEEIRNMIIRNKVIFLHFISCKEFPEDVDNEQWNSMQKFKLDYAKKGIYIEINDNIRLYKEKLLKNLRDYFDSRSYQIHCELDKDWAHYIDQYSITFSYENQERTIITCEKIFEITALINDYQFLTDRYGWKENSYILSVEGGKIVDTDIENNPYHIYTIKLEHPLSKGDSAKIKVKIRLENVLGTDPCYLSYSPNMPIKKLVLRTVFYCAADIKSALFAVYEGISGRSPVESDDLCITENKIEHVFGKLTPTKRYSLKWIFNE